MEVCADTLVVSYGPGSYTWTVPDDGLYKIECAAGAGGNAAMTNCNEHGTGYHGGNGGRASGEIFLTAGQVLTISVGSKGHDDVGPGVGQGQQYMGQEVHRSGGSGGGSSIVLAGVSLFNCSGGGGASADCYYWSNVPGHGVSDSWSFGSSGSGNYNTSRVTNGSTGSNAASAGYVRITRLSWLVTYNENKPTVTTNTVTGNVPNLSVNNGASGTVTYSEYSLVGYIFKGWNTKPNGSGTSYKAGDTITPTSDLTLYAQWEPITYTVNVYPNNNPVDATNTIQSVNPNNGWTWNNDHWTKLFTYDSTTLEKASSFYSLVGWHTDDSKLYSQGGTNGDASGTGYTTPSKNLTYTDKDVINLYPKWIKNKYTIYYNGNDTDFNIDNNKVTTQYSGSVAPTICYYDTDVILSTNSNVGFSKSGYSFIGWSKQKESKTAEYLPGQKLEYLKGEANFTTVDGGSLTLYAIWEPITYTVVLEPEGGVVLDWNESNEQYKFKIKFDSETPVVLPDEIKEGYEFTGWGRRKQTESAITNSNGNLLYNNILEFYDFGNKVICLSNDKTKHSFDIHFNPLDTSDELKLWAWFNWTPRFIDVYDGLFFEGQKVTYTELLELVRAWDYEDNYIQLQDVAIKNFFTKLTERVDNNISMDENQIEFIVQERDILIYKNKYEEELEKQEKNKEEIDKLDIKIEELRVHLEDLFLAKENIEQERTKALDSLTDRANILKVNIAELNYYGANTSLLKSSPNYNPDLEIQWETPFNYGVGIDTTKVKENYNYRDYTNQASNGIYKVKTYNYNSKYLRTCTANIGLVDITYQVSDKGIKYTDINGNEKTIPKSDLTLEYTRRCQINFNYNPLVITQGIVFYDEDIPDGDLASAVINQQAVMDSEDIMDNIPWWSTYLSSQDTIGKVLKDYNQNTIDKLQSSLVITGIPEYKFNEAFKIDYPEAVSKFLTDFTSPESDRELPSEFYATDKGKYYIKDVGLVDILNKAKLLNEVYKFKDNNEVYYNNDNCYITKADMWNALTGISVTFDAMDQWGKYASNSVSEERRIETNTDDTPGLVNTDDKPDGDIPEFNGGYGGTDTNPDNPDNPDKPKEPYDTTKYEKMPERTTEIIIINSDGPYSDDSLKHTVVEDEIRYINEKYLDSLGQSYWGTYGKEILNRIIKQNSIIKIQNHKGQIDTNNNGKVEIEINDYETKQD